MAQDPIPSGDSEFDTLQAILIAAVILKATDWGIPAGEITKLTDKQSIWAAIWAIAKNKQNSTSAQKQEKDDARKEFEKVLRPFIQKWIYRNESMNSAAIELCGLKPHDGTHTPATKPGLAVAKVKRGVSGELITGCDAVEGAKHYGCIMSEGAPLPSWVSISADGKLLIEPPHTNPTPPPTPQPDVAGIRIDLTDQREKHFTGLTPGTAYYFYYFAINTAGVGPLSEPVSLVAW